MNGLPTEILYMIGMYLSLTDLRRFSHVNHDLSQVGISLLKRRLEETSIMVVSFITYYSDDLESRKGKDPEKEKEKEEVICKIYLGPVTRAERDSLVNESAVIQSSGRQKFVTRSASYKFHRVEISETLLGSEVPSDELLPILLGYSPLLLSRHSRLTPTIPLLSSTKSSKRSIRVNPTVHYCDAPPITRREKNKVVYHLAFDGQSEFFMNLEN